eukprot:m.21090 g.21090  ORF g.21090 m.21090 type:complete len:183 (+) comp5324_c0_seq1:3346-3894(+)
MIMLGCLVRKSVAGVGVCGRGMSLLRVGQPLIAALHCVPSVATTPSQISFSSTTTFGATATASHHFALRPMATFRELYPKTPLGLVDELRGKEVEGVVACTDEGIRVDIGLKFPAIVDFASKRDKNRDSLQVGDKVVVSLSTPELAQHLLGSSKHTTTLVAKASFVRLVMESVTSAEGKLAE